MELARLRAELAKTKMQLAIIKKWQRTKRQFKATTHSALAWLRLRPAAGLAHAHFMSLMPLDSCDELNTQAQRSE